jgi:heptosyltransferase-1
MRKKVLIVRTGYYGDIAGTLSSLSLLRNNLKDDTDFYWLVSPRFADIIQGHPFLRETILYRKQSPELIPIFESYCQSGEFDYILDYQEFKYSYNSIRYHCLPGLSALGAKMFNPSKHRFDLRFLKRLFQPSMTTYQAEAEEFTRCFLQTIGRYENRTAQKVIHVNPRNYYYPIPAAGLGAKVLVSIGSSKRRKMLKQENWLRFLSALAEQGPCCFMFTWNSPDEKSKAEILQKQLLNAILLPRLSIASLYSVLSQVDLVLSVDSLMMHLAALMDTPSFTFFGPSCEKLRPDGVLHASIQGRCNYRLPLTELYVCPLDRLCSSFGCIKDLNIEEAIVRFREWWADIESYHQKKQAWPIVVQKRYQKTPFHPTATVFMLVLRFFIR